MRQRATHIVLVVFFQSMCLTLHAQNFPVQASVQLSPPYSLYLQDYTSEDNKISLMILMKDLNRNDYRVRLRISIEGNNGLSIVTNPQFIPAPMLLQGGMPLSVTGPELAEYFNPINMMFTGISRQEFATTGRLPEGPYRFCVEVLDYNLGIPVSNKGCNVAWLILNDPPMINVPMNNSKVRAIDPQNIVFQWTPRHTASPNAAFNTEYYFRLVEVWPVDRNPFDALNVGTPIYETTTSNTALIYSLAEPQLVPGRRYAFRVQARNNDGTVGRDIFKNSGYSEVFSFQYEAECKFPLNLKAESPDGSRLRLTWDQGNNHSQYTLQFRETGNNMTWREQSTFLNYYTINSLKPGTSYDVQISGLCGVAQSVYSPAVTLATMDAGTGFECGRAPESFNLDNTAPLTNLVVGDVILSGDFEIEITEASGSEGVFTGKGSLPIPFMNYVKVPVTFNAISINTDKRVFKGNVIVNMTGTGL